MIVMTCIWCGKRIDDDDDGASFRFLAKRNGQFVNTADWLDRSPHLEGHQFFCHAQCFRASVPEERQSVLAFALDEG